MVRAGELLGHEVRAERGARPQPPPHLGHPGKFEEIRGRLELPRSLAHEPQRQVRALVNLSQKNSGVLMCQVSK